jgi:hypothetical protein
MAAIGEPNYSRIEKLYIYSSCCVEQFESEDLKDHIADLHRRRNFPFVVIGFEHDYTDDAIDPVRVYRLGFPPPAQKSRGRRVRHGVSSQSVANV